MPRASMTIYRDANFKGPKAEVDHDIADLSEWEGHGEGIGLFHDSISSIEIHSGTWEFWRDIHYSGPVYTYSNGRIGFPPKDTISSIKKVSDYPT